MKRILDSVHGHISVKDRYFPGIIDTPHFQRLRHIEQTSTRSIFPSARHDRFIHSLGVFHIGNMICDHLIAELKDPKNDHTHFNNARLEIISETYRLGCLLHDIGHAPFSHTFENYYGTSEKLAQELCASLETQGIASSIDQDLAPNIDLANPHEYTSAIVCVKHLKQRLEQLGAKIDLLVRMIIGCKYTDQEKSLENCFIDLLHGDLIDADRIDYACRDVWASGYSTSKIDLTRLVSGIHIIFDKSKKQYLVAYDLSCINEIESVMQVKDFQTRYTINHHKVHIEQWLLVKAVENLAQFLYPDEPDRQHAIHRLFNIESLDAPITVNDRNEILSLITDGDLIYLMKKQGVANPEFQEWFSRQYTWKPVWKAPQEFNAMYGIAHGKTIQYSNMLDITRRAMDSLKIPEKRWLLKEAKYKPKVSLKDANILTKSGIVKGKDVILPEPEGITYKFNYLYLKIENEEDLMLIPKIKDIIRPYLQEVIATL